MSMDAKKALSLALVVACTVLPILAIIGYEAARTRDLTHEILARAPERGNFTPGEIKVTVGEKIRLRIRNVDTVMHGFAIPDLKVDAGEISAGHQAIVEFTPTQVGRYDFYCTTWCSEYHLQMKGVLEVVPKGAATGS